MRYYNQTYLNELRFREDEFMNIEEKVMGSIQKIDNEILNGNHDSCKRLYEIIVEGYKIEIPEIDRGLREDFTELGGEFYYLADYEQNLEVIKERLELYLLTRHKTRIEKTKEDVQLQSPFNINVTNTNTSSSDNHSTNTNNTTNTTTVDLKVMFEQAKKAVEDNEHLSPSDYEDIMAKINELEQIANSGENKRSKWAKCVDVMNWICDKGAPTAVAILPLITEIIK